MPPLLSDRSHLDVHAMLRPLDIGRLLRRLAVITGRISADAAGGSIGRKFGPKKEKLKYSSVAKYFKAPPILNFDSDATEPQRK